MKFRLKMDLSQFYDDERNQAYILVDPSWDQVICLQQHVQNLFDVPEVQFLTDDGIYIPPRESIDVIKINDVLRAIVPQKSKKKKKKSKSSPSNGFETVGSEPMEDSLEVINGDKRKCSLDDDKLACSTPNLRPKKKQRRTKELENGSNSTIILNDQSQIKELEETSIEALQNSRSNVVTSSIDSKETKKVCEQSDNANEDTIKSRSRKRSRKSKKQKDDQEKDEKNSRLSSVPIPISSSTLRLSNTISTPNHSTKHVHFSDEDSLTLVESKEGQVIYRSLLSMDCEARVIEPDQEEPTSPAPKTEDQSQLEKPKIQIHENIVLVPAAPVVANDTSLTPSEQLDDENCSVIEVDDSVVRSELGDDEAANDTANDIFSDINVDRILPLSEELSELPNVGDVILFKMYQLSENFTPEISKYICGRCETVDPEKKTLICLVLDGLDELDANDENRVLRKGKINCFQFPFNDMLDKRVFRM